MKARVRSDGRRKEAVDACDRPCAIERGMRILGGKWTGSVLWHLQDAPVRFNDLARMVGGASKKMVVERLRHLQAHGLVERRVLDTSPPGVAYAITDEGRRAVACLDALRQWSEGLDTAGG